MKLLTFILIGAFVSAVALPGMAAETVKKKKGKVRHMVAFKFNDTATKEQIKEVETAFAALPSKISQITKFEWGTNVSPEKHDKGFTHGYILSFKNEKDRDTYLEHPAHKEFGKLVGPVLADVFVIDFIVKKGD